MINSKFFKHINFKKNKWLKRSNNKYYLSLNIPDDTYFFTVKKGHIYYYENILSDIICFIHDNTLLLEAIAPFNGVCFFIKDVDLPIIPDKKYFRFEEGIFTKDNWSKKGNSSMYELNTYTGNPIYVFKNIEDDKQTFISCNYIFNISNEKISLQSEYPFSGKIGYLTIDNILNTHLFGTLRNKVTEQDEEFKGPSLGTLGTETRDIEEGFILSELRQ